MYLWINETELPVISTRRPLLGSLKRGFLYFDEVNKKPVGYYWTYKLDEISLEEVATAIFSIFVNDEGRK